MRYILIAALLLTTAIACAKNEPINAPDVQANRYNNGILNIYVQEIEYKGKRYTVFSQCYPQGAMFVLENK